MTREAVGKQLGIHPNTLKRYEDDERTPPEGLVDEVAAIYGVDAGWLRSGTGHKPPGWVGEPVAAFRRDDVPAGVADAGASRSSTITMPVFDPRRAGRPGGAFHPSNMVERIAFPRTLLDIPMLGRDQGLCLAFISGAANEPELRDGDRVVIDLDVSDVHDDAFYAIDRGGDILFRFVERTITGGLVVKTRNPAFESRALTEDEARQLKVIGRVIWAGGPV